MISKFQLSYSKIIENINDSTPFCVIEEIARSHHIRLKDRKQLVCGNKFLLNELILRIKDSEYKQPYISIPIRTDQGKSDTIHFINPYIEWSENELNMAVSNVVSFFNNSMIIPPVNFSYGMPTPSKPDKLTVCILYRLCMHNNLPTNYNTTIDQMASAIKIIYKSNYDPFSFIYKNMHRINKDNLAKFYILTTSLIEEQQDDPIELDIIPDNFKLSDVITEIQTTCKIFNSKKNLMKRIKPNTNAEAISLAALNYKIDISESKDHIKEYINLLNSKKLNKLWVPLDINLKNKLNLNPFSLSLDMVFNPKLPCELYIEKDIYHLAQNEGFNKEELRRERAYDLLQLVILTPTFYTGKYSNITNTQTPVKLESVDNLDSDYIICFGVKNDGLVAFIYEELTLDFLNKKNFLNPLNSSEHFSSRSIKKLKIICKKNYKNETEEGRYMRNELYKTITTVELFINEKDNRVVDFYNIYLQLNESDKFHIEETMISLFKLSMCCRGWLNDYDLLPIEDAPVLPGYQGYVDIRVCEAITNFENICEKIKPELKDLILNLPLTKYTNGEWDTTININQGINIGDRLRILKEGDLFNGNTSCMRFTSNYFAACSYRYMTIIGLDVPFDIEKLREIS